MTENEIKEYIVNECQNTRCKYLTKDNECVEDGNCFKVKTYIIKILEEIQQYRAIGTVEEIKMLKDFKELYDAYKLIGTIEEFRNLKYKKNVLPIATIEFSKEDMQKIVNEKVAQIELDVQGIRAEAIDEFVKRLKEVEQIATKCTLSQSDGYSQIMRICDEIAEQMKGK